VGSNTAAGGRDDPGPFERCTHDEHRLADDGCVRRGAGGTAEMHTQVAMSVVVHAIEEAVRRIGAQRHDQRDGREERDQTIATETRAQKPGPFGQSLNKRSLRAPGGQPERSGGNPKKR
jgi:hypothetical protein